MQSEWLLFPIAGRFQLTAGQDDDNAVVIALCVWSTWLMEYTPLMSVIKPRFPEKACDFDDRTWVVNYLHMRNVGLIATSKFNSIN